MTQWVIFWKHLNFRLEILASVSLSGDDINSSGENELVTSRGTRHQKGHTQATTSTSIPTDNLVQHKRKAEFGGWVMELLVGFGVGRCGSFWTGAEEKRVGLVRAGTSKTRH